MSYAIVPREPASKQVVFGACQIRGEDHEGMTPTGDEKWAEAVAVAEKTYDAMVKAAPPARDQQQPKRKPTGFVAICQCGLHVGALDFARTEQSDAGRIMGRWLSDGCTVSPRFAATWEVTVEPCQCGKMAGTTTTSKEP